jgi:excisionase family DNA binding protein
MERTMTKNDLASLDSRLDRIEQLVLRIGTQESRPFDLEAAAKYLSISKSHLYQLTSKAKIGHFKPAGKKIYFDKSDLDAYLTRKRVLPPWELKRAAATR